MKRLLNAVIVCFLVLIAIFTFTACDSNNPKESGDNNGSSTMISGDDNSDSNKGDEQNGVSQTIYYTVKFDSQGGTEIISQNVAEGEKAIKPNNPNKISETEGVVYKFKGWYLDGV